MTAPTWTIALPDCRVSDDPGAPIDHTIAPGDEMFLRTAPPGDALWHYVRVGQSAFRCVQVALAAVGAPPPARILDLPCGHGRVLRVLRAGFPAAEIHACDLNRDGVDFCARQFGATPFYSQPDLARVQLPGPYDLIWVGSLMTHVRADRWPGFLGFFRRHLAPAGVCLFTVHGASAARKIRGGESGYGLADPGGFLAAFDRDGFAYEDYATDPGYGLSISTPAWVAARLAALGGVRLVNYHERGWADHQDVVAWMRDD